MPVPLPLKMVNRGAAGLLTKVDPITEDIDLFGEPAFPAMPKVNRESALKDNIRCDGEVVDISTIVQDPMNARLHPDRNLDAIKDSLCIYGQMEPLVVRQQNRVIAAGNGRQRSMIELGWTRCAITCRPMTDAEFHGFALADNRSSELATWDFEKVAQVEQLQRELGGAMPGWSAGEIMGLRAILNPPPKPPPTINLSDRFVVPPFSVLDARQGYWQDRKRQWLSLGIESELGRGVATTWGITPGGQGTGEQSDKAYTDQAKQGNGLLGFSKQARSHYRPNATPGGSPLPAASLKDGRTVRGDGRGRPLASTYGSGGPGDLAAGFKQDTLGAIAPNQTGPDGILCSNATQYAGGYENSAPGQSGTSIFDPVLCELAYRWFSANGNRVLDPFAGGSVRGIVASKLDRQYVGIDLRPEQAEANEEQAVTITPDNKPTWVVGDAQDVVTLCQGPFDFLFSCPPYADLERYSDDPRDLSTMSYDQFLVMYRLIIERSCSLLRDDTFACFVVGDVRDTKTGLYRGFVQDTIMAFRDAGLGLYNDAVLVTAVGSLPIRVGRQFSSARKLGKTHQNVLVFCKGSAQRATEACGPVDVGDLAELLSEHGENLFDE
jgi:hypothetical protein